MYDKTKKIQGSTLSLGNIDGLRSNRRSNCEKNCQHEKSWPFLLFFDKKHPFQLSYEIFLKFFS